MSFLDASIFEILKEGLLGGLSTVLKMLAIIVPLMIFLELLRHYKWIDKITKITSPVLKRIGLGHKATFPLLVGIIFGISYGSGVIIDSVEEGEINKQEVTLILVFLVICHAIFEDTFIFWSLGSNLFILFFGRILGAILITGIFSKLLKEKDQIKDIQKIRFMEHKD